MKIESNHWLSHNTFERIEQKITERLRDHDDPKAIREFMRDIMGAAEYARKEIERLYPDRSNELKDDR